MEITSREEAIRRRMTRYFTGKPCHRGHISERYTVNQGCLECMRPSDWQAQKRIRAAAKATFKTVHFELHADDADTFTAMVLALARLREPTLQFEDIIINRPAPSPRLRSYLAHPGDHRALSHLQATLQWPHLSPETQKAMRDAQSRRMDGWEPPAQ